MIFTGEGVQAKKKICGGKTYSRTRTFGAEVHKMNIGVKRRHNKYKILNYIERRNFGLNDFLTKSNRTSLQIYRVEEPTFETPKCLHPSILVTLYICLHLPNLVNIGAGSMKH